MKFSLVNSLEGSRSLNIISITKASAGNFAVPGERENIFSMIRITSFINCTGIRICCIKTESQKSLDFEDRALFGAGKCYDTIFLEVLFLRIFFS